MATSPYAPTLPRRRVIAPPGLPVRFFPVVVVVIAVALGGAAAIDPRIAVAGALGLALLPLVLAKPIVGLGALVFLSFLEEYSAMTGALSLTKILGAILVLAWLVAVATARRSEREADGLLSREPFLAAALVLLAGWAAMSVVWAEAPELAQNSVLRFALNFVLFPIALVAIRTRAHMLWLVAVFIAGAFAAATLGLLEGTVGDAAAEGRLAGAGINPNQLGSYCVVAAIFGTVLAAAPRSLLARTAVLAVAGLAAIAVFMTLSRGALVGLAVALLVAPLVIGRRRRAAAVVIAVAAVVGSVGWFATVAPPEATERITNPERGGGSGRVDLWRVGWRMVEDKPVWGVGAGNFPIAAIHYLLRPGLTERDDQIVDFRKVAHNIYLTVLSELGAVGLVLFVSILLLSLRCALRAARTFAARGDPVMELVARGLFIGILSMAVVGFFSSALYSKQFWFLMAAAPALRAMASRLQAPPPRATFHRLRPATPLAARPT